MSGIGDQSGTSQNTFTVPLPDTLDAVLDVIRKILTKGNVQRLVMDTNEPIVYTCSGGTVGHEESFQELDILDVVRNVSMVEYLPPASKKGAAERYLDMVALIGAQRLVPTHLVISETSMFWSWLSLPSEIMNSVDDYGGVRIECRSGLADNVFLLCAGRSRSATIAEIVYVVKGACDARTD